MPSITQVSAGLSEVTVSPASIAGDGLTVSVITATINDSTGAPLVNCETGGSITAAVSGTGNAVTAQSTVTDADGKLYWNVVSTVAASKTVTITAADLALSDTPTITVTGEVAPDIEEDFSTYTDTADLLADPRGIYNTVESRNTDRIALDTTVGYGSSTQSMRYDWPNNGSASLDYSIRPGVLEITGSRTHVWVEYVVRFKSNFKVNSGGTAAAEYKLAAAGDLAGTGRWNIPEMQAGQWVLGYPDTVYAVTATPAPNTLWDDDPHVFRVEMRLSPSGNTGILRFWVDGVLQSSVTGFNTGGGHTDIDYFAPGLNLNQGPNISDMSMWWLRYRVWFSNPGWT